MNSAAAAYLALNPKGRVPLLVTDEGSLTETPAILSYLARLHGLTPKDAFKAAQVEEWNAYLCSTVHISHAHRMRGQRWSDDPAVIEGMKVKVAQNMSDHFAYLERRFVGPFVLGETFTTADAYTFTIAGWLAKDGAEHKGFPENRGAFQEDGSAPFSSARAGDHRRVRRYLRFAGDPVAIAVKLVNVATDHIDRPHHIGRAVATATGAIDIRGNRNAGPRIVRVTARRFRSAGGSTCGKGDQQDQGQAHRC